MLGINVCDVRVSMHNHHCEHHTPGHSRLAMRTTLARDAGPFRVLQHSRECDRHNNKDDDHWKKDHQVAVVGAVTRWIAPKSEDTEHQDPDRVKHDPQEA